MPSRARVKPCRPNLRHGWSAVVTAAAVLALAAPPVGLAGAQESEPYPDTSPDAYYSEAVEALAQDGVFIETDCDEGFCPDEPIRRGTMAVWTVRVLDAADPAPVSRTRFVDVDASHPDAAFVERFAELGVTKGCGDGTRFCPDDPVRRAEMAVFLSRAFGLEEGPETDFRDVPPDAWYAPDVNNLAASGITRGCGDGTRFCPDQPTSRAQMAAFLFRALGLIDKPDPTEPTPAGAATYRAITDTCAILTDDTITCWGNNNDGEANAPAGTYKTLTTGSSHNCAIATDNTITCWGRNWRGETDAPAGTYNTITTGRSHSCAIATNDTITCWGNNSSGQTDAPAGTYQTVATDSDHTCAIATDNTITCWGNNEHGQADPPAGTYQTVATDSDHSDHTCAIATNDTITCWGNNEHGQADPPAGTYKTVTTGWSHSCAIATNDTITCWGNNEHGQADPPQTTREVLATQPIAPIDLSAGSAPDHVSSDVLDFDMIDASTGATINLRSVVNGKTPLLFWLYSPY